MDFSLPILMAGGGQGGQGSGFVTLGFFAIIFLIMYLMLIRPQRKKQKEHEQLLASLKRGDKVVTSGGMFGTIFAIDDDRNRVVIKIGENVKMEFLKSSIAARVDN
ncbi:MAG: preprotein translocase subunit YajC [Candidatus Zixiibacteriota bacterium]|nr:MAG: preprotein translocase subunit YajC [candidate division Zixibacteria bacterium]